MAQSPEVATNQGKVQGLEVTYKSKTLTKFLGIPFAKPPVGELRFMKPQPLEKWNDVKLTKKYSDACMEAMTYPMFGVPPNYSHSEDCLYLNIFVPGTIASVKAKPRAVMFWIYGGGWATGNANIYPGDNLAITEDVIVVTSNYRLGLFGFIASHDDVIPGNVGLFDQHAALKWVNENIAAFGGDVSKITIFGESAGADSVYNHFVSPLSNNLFSRAIIQSTPNMRYLPTKKEQADVVKGITKDVCPSQETSEDLLKCLQSLSADKFLEVSNSAMAISYLYVCVDGEFLPDHPGNLMVTGAFKKSKEVIVGYTSHDGDVVLIEDEDNWKKLVTSGLRMDEVKTYVSTAVSYFLLASEVPNKDMLHNLVYQKYFSCEELKGPLKLTRGVINMFTDSIFTSIAFEIAYHVAVNGGKVYLYEFEHKPEVIKDKLDANMELFASHADDLVYVFGMDAVDNGGMKMTENEKKLSESLMKAFAEFSRTGSPKYITNTGELAEWSPYTYVNMKYLKFTETMSADSNQMVPESRVKGATFWTKVIRGIHGIDTCDALVIRKDGHDRVSSKGTRGCSLKITELVLFVLGTMMLYRRY